ncbi:hypothetical protein EVAR_43101_1 [Eumeta japonica]|uniref:Uncharacterized protein n=1 Tax=Eumeta variegata TaxID=151549 RepID=A0A4C1YF83_EUMVA|nr:hypothetical protein EVAR_43101_1 [Eumeta japonica]
MIRKVQRTSHSLDKIYFLALNSDNIPTARTLNTAPAKTTGNKTFTPHLPKGKPMEESTSKSTQKLREPKIMTLIDRPASQRPRRLHWEMTLSL